MLNKTYQFTQKQFLAVAAIILLWGIVFNKLLFFTIIPAIWGLLAAVRWEWALWPLVTSGICDNFLKEIPSPTTEGEAVICLVAGGISVVMAIAATVILFGCLVMASVTLWDWANGKKASSEPTEQSADTMKPLTDPT